MHALKLKTVHNVFKYKEILNSRSNKSVTYQTTKNLYYYHKYLNEISMNNAYFARIMNVKNDQKCVNIVTQS